MTSDASHNGKTNKQQQKNAPTFQLAESKCLWDAGMHFPGTYNRTFGSW